MSSSIALYRELALRTMTMMSGCIHYDVVRVWCYVRVYTSYKTKKNVLERVSNQDNKKISLVSAMVYNSAKYVR